MNFDPFAITGEHGQHASRVNIINLEASGRVFCPLCLEIQLTTTQTSASKDQACSMQDQSNRTELSEEAYQQYLRNLLEALDQRSENNYLRRIILPILEAVSRRRAIRIIDESDYHNLLRIIYKVINSHSLELNEFTATVKIFTHFAFSALTNELDSRNSSQSCSQNRLPFKSIPLLSIWKVIEQMFKYANKKLETMQFLSDDRHEARQSNSRVCKFSSSLFIIIYNYLKLMRYYSLDQVSDMILPLSVEDDPILHNRKHYLNNQIKCLDLFTEQLLNRCLNTVHSTKNDSISEQKFMIGHFFDCLTECFLASIRMKHKLEKILKEKDFILIAHDTISNNKQKVFRKHMRKFLQVYVDHYTRNYFASDESDIRYETFMKTDDIVETNFRNAIVTEKSDRYNRTVFYLTLNSVAQLLESKYFKISKLKYVADRLDSILIRLFESGTLMKSFNYLIAKIYTRIEDTPERIRNFMKYIWCSIDQNQDCDIFHSLFCSNETIFYWALENGDFAKVIKQTSVKYIFEKSISNNSISQNLKNLLCHDLYKRTVCNYLRYDESSQKVIQEVAKIGAQMDGYYKEYYLVLIQRLSSTLPPLLYNEIMLVHDNINLSTSRTNRLLHMNIALMKTCSTFDMLLDHQMITDIFKFIEHIFCHKFNEMKDTLILLTELISLIISSNNSCLMVLMKHLDYSALGYYLHHLTTGSILDELTQVIANMVVAYDNLDYPLRHNIIDNLSPSSTSLMKWMLSDNQALHNLALKAICRNFNQDGSKTSKAGIVVAFIHLVYNNPNLIKQKQYIRVLSEIYARNEFIYCPLNTRIVTLTTLQNQSKPRPPPSPPLSFVSAESNAFEEDHMEINQILSQLDGGFLFNNEDIPENLFVTGLLQDQLSRAPDTTSWEQMAQEIIVLNDDTPITSTRLS